MEIIVWLVIGAALLPLAWLSWHIWNDAKNSNMEATRAFEQFWQMRDKIKELRNKLTDQDSEITDLRAEIKAMEDQIEAYEASQDGCDMVIANLTCELRKRENVLRGIGRLMDGLK
jgi:chromosome segregation ATPase